MDTRLLRSFFHVAELGSLSRASHRLNVTQPALSRQIRMLEEQLGEPLFVRTGRGLRTTEAGAWLQERAATVLGDIDRLKSDFDARRGIVSGPLRVGCLPSVVDLVAEHVLPEFRTAHPGVSLDIDTASSAEIQDGILNRSLDVGLMYDANRNAAVTYEQVSSGVLHLVAPARSGLSPDRPVAFTDVAGLTFVLPKRGQGLRWLIDGHAGELGLSIAPWLEVDTPQLLLALVRRGLAHTILPWPAIRSAVRHGEVEAAPIERPVMRYAFVAAWSSIRPLSRQSAAFLDGIRERLSPAAAQPPWSEDATA